MKARYDYKPEFRLSVHPDDWRWADSDAHGYRWREHDGRGYWRRGGVWIDFQDKLMAVAGSSSRHFPRRLSALFGVFPERAKADHIPLIKVQRSY